MFVKNASIINLFIYLYITIYVVVVSLFVMLFGWFTLWLTGIQQMFSWLAVNLNWLEIMYLSIVVLILTTTGYIFYHMLECMEQNLILIREDRRNLLQENLDLVNENKELKQMFNKIVRLTELNVEDKKIVGNF